MATLTKHIACIDDTTRMAAASLQNDLSKAYVSIQTEMAVYVDAFEGIEKDTGIPLAYVHNLVAKAPCWNGSPTMETPAATRKGVSKTASNEIEVEFAGPKTLIQSSDSEDVYEVARKW
eukprot:CAMPEP_0117042110 /NCGR_PEP_ID=MMETSP0472-20121206/29352_1 /TAXON_ID=693140 ORGANISM="Tiarina fusus, Strain LIS" /NCGR_SAMPLE_ID=MMETSP0472 /ASSEMBLY_ACC=CAM_ASM_000603 /LENGTH=118 /DNA_ID=CAMNT_0004753275 /DNA_START=129 /DNA_END=482 /DNA_ORIENTATION=-